ncbi:Cell division protein FtsH [Methanosarcina sp. MTP4]|uniref:ATP-binding protein n=1 Tax=Methanosarcina sp. MTP4 TaxID=1434100 RepID=UPI0006160D06|nr:AAA family ATPase [Methanosarcina sp. MTP4]AKB24118.1 Cell division protein FtsH [Methanosarcina sp. MTP4]
MKVDLTGPLYSSLENATKDYKQAKAEGNAGKAKKKALECAKIMKVLAEKVPSQKNAYLEKAEKWERMAGNVENSIRAQREGSSRSGKSRGRTGSGPDRTGGGGSGSGNGSSGGAEVEGEDELLAQAEALIEKSSVHWDDIGGLEEVKRLMKETIAIAGLQKPSSVKPWKGIMLFGPPGTGKTLLAAAAAGSLDAEFFNVKADNVLSKYFGESSKLVSALYKAARNHAPSIVFIDEFDSISLSREGETSESSRRLLSTLLSELDGLQDKKSNRLMLTLAATNTPWDLDAAVLSRFPRRIMVPLPDKSACKEIIKIHIKDLDSSKLDLEKLASTCVEKFYAGRDLQNLCQQAMWNMIREENKDLDKLAELPYKELEKRKLNVTSLKFDYFETAFEKIRSPLTKAQLAKYEKWNEEFGG